MRKSSKNNVAAASNALVIVPTDETIAHEAANLETISSSEARNGIVIDNESGETIEPTVPNTATEAKPDARAERAARIAADREAVAALYAGFEKARASVPVKALSAFKLASTTAHPIARNVSIRQCAAIATAFTAAGRKLATGAKAPRVFEIDGIPSAIENGVLRDAVSSGLITVSGETPESEILTLAPAATKAIIAQLGSTLLSAAGIMPAQKPAKAA